MRRREKVDPDGAPASLTRYREADWVGVGCHPACAFWEAVEAWLEAHPDGDVEVVDGPDVPFHRELI